MGRMLTTLALPTPGGQVEVVVGVPLEGAEVTMRVMLADVMGLIRADAAGHRRDGVLADRVARGLLAGLADQLASAGLALADIDADALAVTARMMVESTPPFTSPN